MGKVTFTLSEDIELRLRQQSLKRGQLSENVEKALKAFLSKDAAIIWVGNRVNHFDVPGDPLYSLDDRPTVDSITFVDDEYQINLSNNETIVFEKGISS